MERDKKKPPFKCGYVAIVGKPNVGKSTLMNALLRQRLTIVSPKPQTTRHRILGILSGENEQIIFLDTPGLIKPKYMLQKAMLQAARKSIQDADVLLVMISASHLNENDESMIDALQDAPMKKLLLINKIDLVKKAYLLPIMDRFQKEKAFAEIVPISALRNEGLDLLHELILKYLPENPPLYPSDMLSDEPERFFVSEIIREQIFRHFGEEIPYATAVQVETFQEKPGHKDFIKAVITVEHNSQKGILIGKKGQALKKIGSRARERIEQFLERPVYLELEVRVRKKWRKSSSYVKAFGYGP
ncbi:MAG: GTPase Era [Syntrophaceae bacterium]|nr:GTPase Era [Syntrophaceae bacterium]